MKAETHKPLAHLRYARELKGWSQQELARQLGTTPSVVNRWEKGSVFPSPYYRQRLMQIFEKQADELGLVQEKLGAIDLVGSQSSFTIASGEQEVPLSQTEHVEPQQPAAPPRRGAGNLPRFALKHPLLLIAALMVGTASITAGVLFLVLPHFTAKAPLAGASPRSAREQALYQQIINKGTPDIVDSLTYPDTLWDQYTKVDTVSQTRFGCIFRDGAYHAFASAAWVPECYLLVAHFQHFAFQVQMKILTGDGGGLIFRTGGAHPHTYRFRVSTNGYYDLYLRETSERIVSGHSPVPVAGSSNVLAVIVEENTMYLYVNRYAVTQYTISDGTTVDGSLGVFATTGPYPADVAFNNATVWEL